MSENESGTTPVGTGNGRSNIALVIGGLLVLSGILYWGFTKTPEPIPEPETVTTPPEPVVTPKVPEVEEVIPEPMPPEPEVVETLPEPEPEVPAITLADSDAVVTAEVEKLNGGPLATQFVQRPNTVERAVAIVDNLRQGAVPYKLLPVGRPGKAFPFQDNGLAVTMNPEGFARYDGLANAIAALDVPAIVGLYEWLSPAVTEAWNMLGYTDTTFEEAALTALGMIMLAPDSNLEARLIKVEANWVYEDEALESLSPIQKQMMRMGPDNAEKVQAKARELRGALLDLKADPSL